MRAVWHLITFLVTINPNKFTRFARFIAKACVDKRTEYRTRVPLAFFTFFYEALGS